MAVFSAAAINVFCSAVISITTVPSAVSDVPQVCCCHCRRRRCCCLPLPTLPDQLPTTYLPNTTTTTTCLSVCCCCCHYYWPLMTTAKTTHCCFTYSLLFILYLLLLLLPLPKEHCFVFFFNPALFYPFLFSSLHMCPSSPALLPNATIAPWPMDIVLVLMTADQCFVVCQTYVTMVILTTYWL